MHGKVRRGIAVGISGALLGATLLIGGVAVSANSGDDCLYGTVCASTVRAEDVLDRGTVNPDTGDVTQDTFGGVRVDDTRAPVADADTSGQ